MTVSAASASLECPHGDGKGARVALKGDRKGQQSIRINDQWRLCFRWQKADAYDVEIVEYH